VLQPALTQLPFVQTPEQQSNSALQGARYGPQLHFPWASQIPLQQGKSPVNPCCALGEQVPSARVQQNVQSTLMTGSLSAEQETDCPMTHRLPSDEPPQLAIKPSPKLETPSSTALSDCVVMAPPRNALPLPHPSMRPR